LGEYHQDNERQDYEIQNQLLHKISKSDFKARGEPSGEKAAQHMA
jgi:hypothetical protein